MRLTVFLGSGAESEKAVRILRKIDPDFPELELERRFISEREAGKLGLKALPVFILEGKTVAEGKVPAKAALTTLLRNLRQPASKAVGEPLYEGDELFE